MKTNALILAAVLTIATTLSAQPESDDVISRAPDAKVESKDAVTTTTETYSLNAIASQLRELHQAVEDTLPMLNAVTQTNLLTGPQPSSQGGLGGILGEILRGDTNRAPDGSRDTNTLGGILRGVLGTNATASVPGGSTTLNDLLLLREQLLQITPVLERLDSSALSTNHLAVPSSDPSTNGLTPTGRDD